MVGHLIGFHIQFLLFCQDYASIKMTNYSHRIPYYRFIIISIEAPQAPFKNIFISGHIFNLIAPAQILMWQSVENVPDMYRFCCLVLLFDFILISGKQLTADQGGLFNYCGQSRGTMVNQSSIQLGLLNYPAANNY